MTVFIFLSFLIALNVGVLIGFFTIKHFVLKKIVLLQEESETATPLLRKLYWDIYYNKL